MSETFRLRTVKYWLLMLLILGGPAAPAHAQALPQNDDHASVHVVIGVDISRGSPFTARTPIAKKAARRIAREIKDLPMRAVVSLRTFGGHGTSETTLSVDRQISVRNRPARLALLIKTLIEGIPQLVERGRLVTHKESNIVGFLTSMSRSARCGERPTIVILATDGIEDSSIAHLARGGSLPKPSAIFDGCTRLEMLGIGQGAGSFPLTERLIKEWREWAEAAGFISFIGLDTW